MLIYWGDSYRGFINYQALDFCRYTLEGRCKVLIAAARERMEDGWWRKSDGMFGHCQKSQESG